MRFTLVLLLFIGLWQPGFGQRDAQGNEMLVNLPAPFPLLMQVRTLRQRPSFDDSLARHYYARNRVKTVTLLRLPTYGTAPDTVEYTELDRAGYAVRSVNPLAKRTIHRRYNHHQLITSTTSSKYGVEQTVFDPATKSTTTHVGPTLAQLSLSQTGHETAAGYEVFLLAAPQSAPPSATRILLRNIRLGGDTLRLDVLGYRNEQVVRAESYYFLGPTSQQRESGTIVLPTVGRPHRSLEGHYIPSQRYTYNAAGWLVRSQSLPTPPSLAAKPVTQTSADGNSSVTIHALADTLTTTYTRDARGQLLREDFLNPHYRTPGKPLNLPAKAYSPRFSTYDYLPNGLRSRSEQRGTRYEYRYTFY